MKLMVFDKKKKKQLEYIFRVREGERAVKVAQEEKKMQFPQDLNIKNPEFMDYLIRGLTQGTLNMKETIKGEMILITNMRTNRFIEVGREKIGRNNLNKIIELLSSPPLERKKIMNRYQKSTRWRLPPEKGKYAAKERGAEVIWTTPPPIKVKSKTMRYGYKIRTPEERARKREEYKKKKRRR